MASPALTLVQPMQSLPSLLALADLRRQASTAIRASREMPAAMAELLALDPLTVLRAMRLVCAPVHGRSGPPRTVREIVDLLGTKAVGRLLTVPGVDEERTRRIRVLWRRTVARACAAELLARDSGVDDPRRAYLAGLVRDLDSWLRHLGLHHNGIEPTWRGADLVRHWCLLDVDAGLPRQPFALDAAPAELVRAAPERLLDAADALADAAGYTHPDAAAAPAEPEGATQAAVAALREIVDARFARFGLFDEPGDGEPAESAAEAPHRDRASMVPRLIECRSAGDSGSLCKLAVAAAVRYLDFDRAFVLTWNPQAHRAWFRSKADLAKLGIVRRPVRPTDRESDALTAARASGEPQVLVRGGVSEGLCGHIAADRALVVPLVPDQRSPSFLVVDRALSTRPIDALLDTAGLRELGGFLTLLFDNLDLRLRRRRTQRSATLDPLTGLANRGVGIFTLDRSIASAKRSREPLCVMMLDLDQFKSLNDRYGHQVGDRALRLAATVLRRTVRAADTVCRYGGEEFLAILPNTRADEATILATRLFTEVAEAGRLAGLPLTVSIGLSSLRPTDDLDSLVNRADRALYVSKSRGRNRFSADTD